MASSSAPKPAYDPKDEDPRRREIKRGLGKIYLAMRNYEDHVTYLDKEMLAMLNIEVHRMSLDSGKSDRISQPFFVPLDNKIVNAHWPKVERQVADEWPNLSHFSDDNFNAAVFAKRHASHHAYYTFFDYHTWDYRSANDADLERTLYYIRPAAKQQWLIARVHSKADLSYPHMRGELIEMAEMDDRLLKSEVWSISVLMLQRFVKRKTMPHRLVPIFLFTYAGRKARVLQAVFEGNRLIIQKSDIINFEKKNVDGMKCLARWYLCEATGKTRWDVPPTTRY